MDKCVCGKLAMHSFGDKHLCCVCNIDSGGAPADWHTECMKYWEKLKNKREYLNA